MREKLIFNWPMAFSVHNWFVPLKSCRFFAVLVDLLNNEISKKAVSQCRLWLVHQEGNSERRVIWKLVIISQPCYKYKWNAPKDSNWGGGKESDRTQECQKENFSQPINMICSFIYSLLCLFILQSNVTWWTVASFGYSNLFCFVLSWVLYRLA